MQKSNALQGRKGDSIRGSVGIPITKQRKQSGPWSTVKDSVITCCPAPTSASLYASHLSGVISFSDQ